MVKRVIKTVRIVVKRVWLGVRLAKMVVWIIKSPDKNYCLDG